MIIILVNNYKMDRTINFNYLQAVYNFYVGSHHV